MIVEGRRAICEVACEEQHQSELRLNFYSENNTGTARAAKAKRNQMAQCKLFKLLPTETANPAEVCVTSA